MEQPSRAERHDHTPPAAPGITPLLVNAAASPLAAFPRERVRACPAKAGGEGGNLLRRLRLSETPPNTPPSPALHRHLRQSKQQRCHPRLALPSDLIRGSRGSIHQLARGFIPKCTARGFTSICDDLARFNRLPLGSRSRRWRPQLNPVPRTISTLARPQKCHSRGEAAIADPSARWRHCSGFRTSGAGRWQPRAT